MPTGHHYCPYEDCRYYGWLGLGIRAVDRVFQVESDTVLDWLLAAGSHLEAFTDYLVWEVAVQHVSSAERCSWMSCLV